MIASARATRGAYVAAHLRTLASTVTARQEVARERTDLERAEHQGHVGDSDASRYVTALFPTLRPFVRPGGSLLADEIRAQLDARSHELEQTAVELRARMASMPGVLGVRAVRLATAVEVIADAGGEVFATELVRTLKRRTLAGVVDALRPAYDLDDDNVRELVAALVSFAIAVDAEKAGFGIAALLRREADRERAVVVISERPTEAATVLAVRRRRREQPPGRPRLATLAPTVRTTGPPLSRRRRAAAGRPRPQETLTAVS